MIDFIEKPGSDNRIWFFTALTSLAERVDVFYLLKTFL